MDLDELLVSIPPYSWHRRLRYRARQLHPTRLRREIRWSVQRWRRGYSDCDVWSLDHYFARVIPPAFRQLARESHGLPGHIIARHAPGPDLLGGDTDAAEKEWLEILEKIAAGFEAWQIIFDTYPRGDRLAELDAKFEEGKLLFIEHFGAFWD